MATSDIKFEPMISSWFPGLERFRLKVLEVIGEPGYDVKDAQDGPSLRIVAAYRT